VDMAEENLTNPDRVSIVCSLSLLEYYHWTCSDFGIRNVSCHYQDIVLYVHFHNPPVASSYVTIVLHMVTGHECILSFLFSPNKLTSSLWSRRLFNASLCWFSWTFLMAYYEVMLRIKYNNTSPSFRPFWIGNASWEKYMPVHLFHPFPITELLWYVCFVWVWEFVFHSDRGLYIKMSANKVAFREWKVQKN
jgi:hypothetical protein